jgi:hypothetical protein
MVAVWEKRNEWPSGVKMQRSERWNMRSEACARGLKLNPERARRQALVPLCDNNAEAAALREE